MARTPHRRCLPHARAETRAVRKPPRARPLSRCRRNGVASVTSLSTSAQKRRSAAAQRASPAVRTMSTSPKRGLPARPRPTLHRRDAETPHLLRASATAAALHQRRSAVAVQRPIRDVRARAGCRSTSPSCGRPRQGLLHCAETPCGPPRRCADINTCAETPARCPRCKTKLANRELPKLLTAARPALAMPGHLRRKRLWYLAENAARLRLWPRPKPRPHRKRTNRRVPGAPAPSGDCSPKGSALLPTGV